MVKLFAASNITVNAVESINAMSPIQNPTRNDSGVERALKKFKVRCLSTNLIQLI